MNNSITLNADTLLDKLMWPATRYCIGRHSYVSSYAEDYWQIIRKNWDKFNYDRLKFFARDIRAEVSHDIGFFSNIMVNNAYNDRIVYDAYTLLAKLWPRYNDVPADKTVIVDCISGEITEVREGAGFNIFVPSDYAVDYLPWIRLANCIDRQYEVDYEVNGRIDKEICIQEPDGTYACVDRWNALLCPEFIKEVNNI